MESLIRKFRQFLWAVQYIYWGRMKISLDTFDGGRVVIDMQDIISVSITVSDDTKQICIFLKTQPEPVCVPLTSHNMTWLGGHIQYLAKDNIVEVSKSDSSTAFRP